ncbi:MAG: 4-hydroxyproline epimerase [Sphingomonas sp.]
MTRHTFSCIDGHTAGNPVRLVIAGAPDLDGATMAERRQDFIARYDWIRTGLMFEPRGHDLMSGGFLYPPASPDSDAAILFMETSGSLPMCGHGTIGMITFALEQGLIVPRCPGRLTVEVPAGTIEVAYEQEGAKVRSVTIRNVPAFVAARDVPVEVPGFGRLRIDIAYGGNFYGIIEPQGAYRGLDDLGAARIVELSRTIRALLRRAITPLHPLDDRIGGVTHLLWADEPKNEGADGRNAVFYGERAIDRSPCGTGTSARLAHLVAKGVLQVGDSFVHESYIGSRFIGRVEAETMVGGLPAIVPSITGSAIATGLNTIWIDSDDPFHLGFSVI